MLSLIKHTHTHTHTHTYVYIYIYIKREILVWFLCLMEYKNLKGYLMPKPFLQKDSTGIIWPKALRNKRVCTFNKGTSSKVNVITQLELELVDYDLTVLYAIH